MESIEDRLERLTEENPAICGGDRVFRGTRISLQFAVSRARNGESYEILREDYPRLSCEQLNLLFELASQQNFS